MTPSDATVSKPKLISIVAPFYNEGEVIEPFFETICSALDEIRNMRFEVICVDDGSTDDTLAKLIALVQR
jgi:polyisoprenyl-phosphate glycosyltransferase